MTARTPVLRGYSLHTIDNIVRMGVRRNTWYAAVDADERYACAWHAVVEELMTAEEKPSTTDLFCIAWRTADDLTRRIGEQHGHGRARGDSYTGRTDMPKWHAYWNTVCRHTGGPEDMVVERTALAQIWPRIPAAHQEALQALAAFGDYQAAADALGLKYPAFCRRIRLAREQFLRLWLEGETPRRGWRDRRRSTPETQLHSVSAHIRKRRRAAAAAAGSGRGAA
ncbi:hypothetical protein [Streptomyces violaceus]|uniref:Sigma-70 family RNA polymerase sigma factor n=1 Tax=Streptomyces violaceus TaxID=1936 RepID=A0ABY9UMY3_STRVL|nr:hypothetical protein [Streptomyces janthinus]WND24178.1 hypothetical protein RI060_43440 [Streptomyces janthinus]GGS96616.1 hypothetical protein GCM10010270_80720 [Streptomyces janthinus]